MHGIGEPALMPDSPGAEHGVELRLLAGVRSRISEGCFKTHAIEWLLRNALDRLGGRHAQQVVDGRGDVADGDVVVANLAVCGNTVGPGDDCGVGYTALVGCVALEQLVGRVEG